MFTQVTQKKINHLLPLHFVAKLFSYWCCTVMSLLELNGLAQFRLVISFRKKVNYSKYLRKNDRKLKLV